MTTRALAPAASGTASPVLRTEPQARLGLRRVPTGAETPTNATARRDAAKRDVRDRFYAEWARICADQAAAESEIDRKFWNGEFA
jgi:hypothetical protein